MVELLDSSVCVSIPWKGQRLHSLWLDPRVSVDSLRPAALWKPHPGAVSLKLGLVHHLLKGL